MSFLTKFFGQGGGGDFVKYEAIVKEVNELEAKFELLAVEELKAKTQELRDRLQGRLPAGRQETLDEILPEAFALTREAAKKTLGQRHFDAQIIGGVVLHEGKIAEMKTGEGKTLTATLAIYLNALTGDGVHVVTVNDYLSKRDANWMGAVFHALGLSVGCIQHEQSFLYEPVKIDKNEVTVEMQNLKLVSRREAYLADITYGTNNEFGFDYLRDNMVADLNEMAQRGHNFAIVDEVDSILIDEARTPLIISAPDEDSGKLYETFSKIAPRLAENDPSTDSGQGDYNLDEKMRAVTLTEAGIAKVEKILGLGNIYTEGGIKYVHHLEQALRAEVMFKRDRNYVVKNDEVIIVDEFTGRLMPGRRYSEGLHQALEAKEGVTVQKESRTLATITFQNYFRLYKKLSGMTGTAMTSAEEFSKVYKLEVVAVPTNQPMIREDMTDSVYRTETGKFIAVAREIKERHDLGQPVLIGTVSIEKNELLSQFLRQEGIPHELLNAKNHEREAQIIANAGRKGAVTAATNMAGRGVDIILGGRFEENPPQPSPKGGSNASGSPPLGGVRGDFVIDNWQKEHDEVVALGGLHIIGTERHEARRIDDQLRGRAGRQGDPGSSQFFVSFEDDLMRIFAPDRIKKLMEAMNIPEDQPIENRMIGRAIESAQAKIEGFNFDTRKHVLEYDDVMNKQRETIYRKRREILESASLREQVLEVIANEITKIVKFHAPGEYQDDWNLEEMHENIKSIFPLPNEARQTTADAQTKDDLIDYLVGLAKQAYEAKEKNVGEVQMREIEKMFYLRTIDMFWMEHLDEMEHLRDSVKLRAYGQKDPLVEYKNEGHKLFGRLLGAIQTSFVGSIYKVEIMSERAAEKKETKNILAGQAVSENKKNKVGRNDPCPCGSGKKYKRCHGA
ncbi:MAG: preprotein translocase subunit SecA [Candidatus Portnoybacteria bacterium RIFCSPLOWO2_02_FULL_39_11]|uniref:Protein translocase subunit SecA n=1 Tax=Candidatus Portnoybacteria bacterium RIFCSPLOWO2_02_FULL_39_11 TaxID=1802001 RepID=A0A1G2FQR6_9BACT|nr:MAG: preprotein translocase subunit SecA [Candidatus Portnoybacteria bacterium RIFCSPLOWO2_02_FULL_39_11]